MKIEPQSVVIFISQHWLVLQQERATCMYVCMHVHVSAAYNLRCFRYMQACVLPSEGYMAFQTVRRQTRQAFVCMHALECTHVTRLFPSLLAVAYLFILTCYSTLFCHLIIFITGSLTQLVHLSLQFLCKDLAQCSLRSGITFVTASIEEDICILWLGVTKRRGESYRYMYTYIHGG